MEKFKNELEKYLIDGNISKNNFIKVLNRFDALDGNIIKLKEEKYTVSESVSFFQSNCKVNYINKNDLEKMLMKKLDKLSTHKIISEIKSKKGNIYTNELNQYIKSIEQI